MVSAVGRVLFASAGFFLLLMYFLAPGDGIPVPPPFQKPMPSLMSFAKRPRHVRVGGLVDPGQIQGPKIPAEPRQPAESPPSVALDVPEREEFLVTWIRRVPAHAPARTEYAEFLALQGRLDEALIQIAEASRLTPEDTEAKAVLGLVLGLRRAEDVKTGNGILSAWYERKLQQAFPPMESLPRVQAEAPAPASSWESERAKLRARFNVTREDFEKQYLPTAEEAMGWLAVRRYFDVKLDDDAEYAARRYRERFSGSPLAVARCALAIFDVGKQAEAESLLVGAITRFPKQLAPLIALEIVRQYHSQKWDLSLWRSTHEFDVETKLLGFNEMQRAWQY